MKNASIVVFVLICIIITGASFTGGSGVNQKTTTVNQNVIIDDQVVEDPICIKLDNAIKKYSAQYKIPIRFAYGVAYSETRYKGPLHTDYVHSQTSYAGAVGPMQIMPYVAKSLLRKLDRIEESDTLTTQRLKTDIDLNVELSMYLLRRLHNRHKDWRKVFGAYNTGKPIINGYAKSVFNFNLNKHIQHEKLEIDNVK